MCEAQCRELLRRQHQRSGVADKVRDLLLRQPHAMPTMEQIAHHFCMSNSSAKVIRTSSLNSRYDTPSASK